jgi:hypothetical protein
MYWHWLKGGCLLAGCFLLAIIFIKPIGVSTQFVILGGVAASFVDDNLVARDQTAKSGYRSSNAYLNKSGGKYAKSVAEPLNYGFVFVIFIALGGLIGRLTQNANPGKGSGPGIKQVPDCHLQQFGDNPWGRYLLAFCGGVIVLLGARLAGGCTSGHMMSGIMQTAVSGYLFALSAFAVAIPTAIIVYRK